MSIIFLILANSLDYPQRMRIEWTQLLKRLCVLYSLLVLFLWANFLIFPLSAFSFYTVQYRRVQYSTVIGQLPRLSTEDEDRVVSVFEFRVCLSVCLSVLFL